jgi:ABC-type dipeptide/oligopeptide/nickel transport system ATPase component
MALVSKISDSICVLSHGKIIEKGNTSEILKSPQKPETKALIEGLIINSDLNNLRNSE